MALVSPHKAKTKTPIKHVVVIFDENISYDHYFGTYPEATNKGGGTRFKAKKDTPKNDNLITAKKLKKNPNLYKPFRLSPSQAVTCDQNHGYTAEQKAYNFGAMDQFVQNVSVDTCSGLFGAPGPHHGLLRRQHRDRPVELRPELRACPTSSSAATSAPRRRVRSTWSPATPTASSRSTPTPVRRPTRHALSTTTPSRGWAP